MQSDEIERQLMNKEKGNREKKNLTTSKEVTRTTQRFTRTTTMTPTEIITRDSFQILEKLGEGSFATVWLVKKKSTGKLYGMKVLEK